MKSLHTVYWVCTRPYRFISPRKAECGVTLIELLVTITVLGIISTIAIPSFTTFIKNARLNTAVTDFQGALTLARSEAVMRRQNVSVCMSTDGSGCNGSSWKDGVLVFTDIVNSNPTGSFANGTDEALKFFPFTNTAMVVTPVTEGGMNGFGSSYVSFKPSGMVPTSGGLMLCDDRTGAFGQEVILNIVGRTQTLSKLNCPAS